ncbi:MAG TPA: L,D-transpeptidase family protein [Candidatus Paceibacterota bacterium]|nr:L,D-transpeptidase family protein [Candidatus Paceibacterota bacterium]
MDIFLKDSHALSCDGKEYMCAIGAAGVSAAKREGDKKTPVGSFPIREVLYRSDRLEKPSTRLPVRALEPDDGWCDDPADPNYNRFVKLPYPASHEKLWREDHVYDIIVVLGYNDDPVVPGVGSAIFLHLARDGYPPTDGCIAVSLSDMTELLALVDANTLIKIPD